MREREHRVLLEFENASFDCGAHECEDGPYDNALKCQQEAKQRLVKWISDERKTAHAQGRLAGLREVERYLEMRLRLAEASLHTEVLAGNEVKQGRERAAIAELHGMQLHVSDIKERVQQVAQAAQGEG